jgi:DNA polymerase-3 subunit alpha
VLNRRSLESLVAAGACDALGSERGALFAGASLMLDAAATVQHEREVGQSSLFGDASNVTVVSLPLPPVPAWLPRDRSVHEKEVLGFYFSEHPLEPLRDMLAKIVTHPIADAADLEDGSEVRIAGLVGETRTIQTRTGKLMGVVTIEDLSGRIECTLFPDTFEQTRSLLTPDAIVVVSGRVEKRDERPARLLLSEVRPLEEARTVYRRSLHLEVRAEDLSEERLADIDQVLSAFPGEAEVYLHIVRPDHTRLAMRSRRFRVAEDDSLAGRLRERHPHLRVRWSKGAP